MSGFFKDTIRELSLMVEVAGRFIELCEYGKIVFAWLTPKLMLILSYWDNF